MVDLRVHITARFAIERGAFGDVCRRWGRVAQLGERCVRNAEAGSSILPASTNLTRCQFNHFFEQAPRASRACFCLRVQCGCARGSRAAVVAGMAFAQGLQDLEPLSELRPPPSSANFSSPLCTCAASSGDAFRTVAAFSTRFGATFICCAAPTRAGFFGETAPPWGAVFGGLPSFFGWAFANCAASSG